VLAAEQAPTDKTVGKATEATAAEKAAIAKDAKSSYSTLLLLKTRYNLVSRK